MVLDFSGSGLIQKGPLQQEDGLLNARWNQDGSSLVNIFLTDLTVDATLQTVTAGKTIYVQGLLLTNGGLNGIFNIRDGSGGTIRSEIQPSATAGVDTTAFFDPPLKFTTSVYFDKVTNCSGALQLTGWEE